MSSNHGEPTMRISGDASGVRLSIDEATVVLGLLDLLQPPRTTEPAVVALVERTRERLASAIADTMRLRNGDGLHAV
jgi:hypothetical protein